MKRREQAEFALDRMCRGQQLAKGLAT